LAVWHSSISDRTQREMLRAANGAWAAQDSNRKSISKEIEWILNETDNLFGKRNDALHAPMLAVMNAETFEFNVEPNYFWGHPMAKRLQGKDVRIEIIKYKELAQCLNKYCLGVWGALAMRQPLHERPVLPKTGPQLNPAESRQSKRRK